MYIYIYAVCIYIYVYVYTYILIYIHIPLLNGCISRWFNPPSSEWPLRSAANTGLTQEGHRKTKLNLGRVRKDLQGGPLEQCDTKMGLKRTRQLALMWCILYNTYIHIHIQYIHIHNIYIYNYIYIHIHMVQLPETLAITTFSLRLDLRSLKKSTFFLSPISTGEPIIAAPPKKWSLHLFQPCHKAGLSDVYKMDFNHVTKNLCIPIIGLFFEARQIDPKNNGQHQEALQPSPSATSKKIPSDPGRWCTTEVVNLYMYAYI